MRISLAKANQSVIQLNSKEALKKMSGKRVTQWRAEKDYVIKQHIQSMKKVSVVELSQQCKVTEETIRRDLDKLEAEGVLNQSAWRGPE